MHTAEEPVAAIAAANEFETFVPEVEPRLRRALATFGFEDGRGAMLETCGSAGKGRDVKEGVPSR